MRTFEKVDENNIKVVDVVEQRSERVEPLDALIVKRAALQAEIDEIDALLLAAHDVGIEKATESLQEEKDRLAGKVGEFGNIPAKS